MYKARNQGVDSLCSSPPYGVRNMETRFSREKIKSACNDGTTNPSRDEPLFTAFGLIPIRAWWFVRCTTTASQFCVSKATTPSGFASNFTIGGEFILRNFGLRQHRLGPGGADLTFERRVGVGLVGGHPGPDIPFVSANFIGGLQTFRRAHNRTNGLFT